MTKEKNNFLSAKLIITGNQFIESIKQIAPKIDANKYVQSVWHECIINPELQKCSVTSIMIAAKTAASVGLMPGKTYGQAWLVPYWNNKTKQLDAQFQFGYKGLIVLAERSGITIYPPNIIYSNDEYDIDEANNKIHHKRKFGVDRGYPVGYYVRYRLQNGIEGFYPMDMMELNKRRDFALDKIKNDSAKEYSPWVKWADEMYKKTVIKSLFNYIAINHQGLEELAKDEEVSEIDITPIQENPKNKQDDWYNKELDNELESNSVHEKESKDIMLEEDMEDIEKFEETSEKSLSPPEIDVAMKSIKEAKSYFKV